MPVSKKRPDIKTAIKQAKLNETVVDICFRGDLIAEVADLDAARDQVLADSSDSLAGPGAALAEADAKLAAAREELVRHTFPFRLRELSYRKWDALELAHPPRTDKPERVNAETFLPALVRASVVDPVLDDEDWTDLLGVRSIHVGDCKLNVDTENPACLCREPVLSKAQFGLLTDAAVTLNSSKDTNVPFGLLASMLRQLNGNG